MKELIRTMKQNPLIVLVLITFIVGFAWQSGALSTLSFATSGMSIISLGDIEYLENIDVGGESRNVMTAVVTTGGSQTIRGAMRTNDEPLSDGDIRSDENFQLNLIVTEQSCKYDWGYSSSLSHFKKYRIKSQGFVFNCGWSQVFHPDGTAYLLTGCHDEIYAGCHAVNGKMMTDGSLWKCIVLEEQDSLRVGVIQSSSPEKYWTGIVTGTVDGDGQAIAIGSELGSGLRCSSAGDFCVESTSRYFVGTTECPQVSTLGDVILYNGNKRLTYGDDHYNDLKDKHDNIISSWRDGREMTSLRSFVTSSNNEFDDTVGDMSLRTYDKIYSSYIKSFDINPYSHNPWDQRGSLSYFPTLKLYIDAEWVGVGVDVTSPEFAPCTSRIDTFDAGTWQPIVYTIENNGGDGQVTLQLECDDDVTVEGNPTQVGNIRSGEDRSFRYYVKSNVGGSNLECEATVRSGINPVSMSENIDTCITRFNINEDGGDDPDDPDCDDGYSWDSSLSRCVEDEIETRCGDGVCDYDETITSCPDDCGGNDDMNQLLLLGAVGLLMGGGIYWYVRVRK